MYWRRLGLTGLLVLSMSGCAMFADTVGHRDDVAGDEAAPWARTNFVTFPQARVPSPLMITGRLSVPADVKGPVPAVVIVHGTGGIDSRGDAHSRNLLRAGIATLQIDLWGPRGVGNNAAERPKDPLSTLPDVFGAFEFLAAKPGIDPKRVGIMGFSWGGAMSVLAAQDDAAQKFLGAGRRFAAHVAMYPVCWAYQRNGKTLLSPLTGAPLLILVGDSDHYEDDPRSCEALAASLPSADRQAVRVRVYADAGHGFDMSETCSPVYSDPFAHRGAGGPGRSCPNPTARYTAWHDVVEHFTRALADRPS